MGNRKAFTDYVVTNLAKVVKGNQSHVHVKAKLESLTDKQFDDFVAAVRDEKTYIPMYISNSSKDRADLTYLVAFAESLGFKPFTRLEVEDPTTGSTYYTEVEYWVGLFSCRRLTQYLLSKISTAKDNKSRDVMTGQVAGSSRSSTFSIPQLGGVLGRGMTSNALELEKLRGGDIMAGRELNQQLISSGGSSMTSILKTNSRPTVINTVSKYLNGAHIQHNL